jgi:hypothetical protein
MDKKKLDVQSNPPIVSYQNLAYPLVIIMKYDHLRNWYINNYVQLRIRDDFFIHDGIDFTFHKSTFDFINIFDYEITDRKEADKEIIHYILYNRSVIKKSLYIYHGCR